MSAVVLANEREMTFEDLWLILTRQRIVHDGVQPMNRRAAASIFVIVVIASAIACSPEPEVPPPAGAPSTDGGLLLDGASKPDGASTVDGGAGTSTKDDASSSPADAAVSTMTLTSPAFAAGGAIPATHSCDGEGRSIPVAWTGAPVDAQSFAIVMRDLTFTNGGDNYHWVIWDIPASIRSLTEGIANTATPDPPGGGAQQTRWSYGAEIGYGNVCPINGPTTHEYELTVHAFSLPTLPLGGAQGPKEIDAVIQAKTIAKSSLRGSYTKQ